MRAYPSEVVVADDVRLRLATPDDAALITEWSQDPAVYTWWGGKPITLEKAHANYTNVRAPEVISYVVEEHNTAVGYIQAWQGEADPECGLDMFLAAEAQGHGLGPHVARALAKHLMQHGWHDITTDPALANERAIRGWRRAGFVDTGQRSTDQGRATMILVFAASATP